MKEGKFRFGAYLSSRGECRKCNERHTGFLLRLKSPFKKELRICYGCLIEYLLSYDPIIKAAEEAKGRIEKHRRKLEKLKKEPKKLTLIGQTYPVSKIERKDNGDRLLSPVLADPQSPATPITKTDGQNRDSDSVAIVSHRKEGTETSSER